MLVDEVGGQVAAVELHTFNNCQLIFQTLTIFNGDDAIATHFVHGFSNQLAHFLVGVGGDGAHLSDGIAVGTRLRQRLQLSNSSHNGLVDTALQIHRVHTGGNGFQTFVDDGLSQNGCSSGTVTGGIVRLGSHFLDHLGAHVLELVFQLDFARNRNTIFSDGRGTEGLVQHHVTAFRAQSHLDGISQDVYAFQHLDAGFVTKLNVFSCHFSSILKSIRGKGGWITLRQSPGCRFRRGSGRPDHPASRSSHRSLR